MTTLNLVTVEEVKNRIRIDGDALDSDIELAIAGASAVCLNYLKMTDLPWADTESVPADVKNACLVMVGTFIRDPDGAESQQWQQGYPPNIVCSILYPLRDPAVS